MTILSNNVYFFSCSDFFVETAKKRLSLFLELLWFSIYFQCHADKEVEVDRGRIVEPSSCVACKEKFSMELVHNRSMFSDRLLFVLRTFTTNFYYELLLRTFTTNFYYELLPHTHNLALHVRRNLAWSWFKIAACSRTDSFFTVCFYNVLFSLVLYIFFIKH